METQEMSTTSILALFETDKAQRESFCMDLISRIDSGEADPLKVHLQIKCLESIIKMLNENTVYKSAVLDASEKQGAKTFQFHNAKFEIKEVGTKYDFSKCNDPLHAVLTQNLEIAKDELKERETLLKSVPAKGMDVRVNDELVTVYPPSKSSVTAVAVTLK